MESGKKTTATGDKLDARINKGELFETPTGANVFSESEEETIIPGKRRTIEGAGRTTAQPASVQRITIETPSEKRSTLR